MLAIDDGNISLISDNWKGIQIVKEINFLIT